MYRIIAKINPIYEAVCYLSNRANGVSSQIFREETLKRHPQMKNTVTKLFAPITQLEKELDEELEFDETAVKYFFSEIKGLGRAACIGSILLMPVTYCGFITNPDAYLNELVKLDEISQIEKFSCYLGHPEGQPFESYDYRKFMAYVFDMKLENSSKYKILESFNSFADSCRKAMELLLPVSVLIEKKCKRFENEVEQWKAGISNVESLDDYFKPAVHFSLPKADYILYPSIFFGLVFNMKYWYRKRRFEDNYYFNGEMAVSLYSDQYISALKNETNSAVPAAIAGGFSDSMRFEILKGIAKGSCNGNDLAKLFNTTRQNIFYHMSKLLTLGIVDCDVHENKPIYHMNKLTVQRLIDALSELTE